MYLYLGVLRTSFNIVRYGAVELFLFSRKVVKMYLVGRKDISDICLYPGVFSATVKRMRCTIVVISYLVRALECTK